MCIGGGVGRVGALRGALPCRGVVAEAAAVVFVGNWLDASNDV